MPNIFADSIPDFISLAGMHEDELDSILDKYSISVKAPKESLFKLSKKTNGFSFKLNKSMTLVIEPQSTSRVFCIRGGFQVVRYDNSVEYVKQGDQIGVRSNTHIRLNPLLAIEDTWILLTFPEVVPTFMHAESNTPAEAPYYWKYDSRYHQTYAAGGKTWETEQPNEVVTQLVSGLVTDKRTQAILDLGCGEGRDSIWLASEGYKVVGVDVSSAALSKARERAVNEDLDVDFLERDVIYLRGIEDRSYDLALNMGCLHMLDLEIDRRMHLQRVFEILKPGGSFLVNHCKEHWLKGFWSVVEDKENPIATPGDVLPRRIRIEDDKELVIPMETLRHCVKTTNELDQELRQVGFTSIEILEESKYTFGRAAILIARKERDA